MKIIPENEVDEAAINEAINWGYNYGDDVCEYEHCESFISFGVGVKFAESKFQDAFKDIIIENQGLKLYKDNEARRFEELAIEFAKYLFSTEITKHTSMENSVKYIPSEFNLMKGNLIKNGEELFKLFLKERNKKRIK